MPMLGMIGATAALAAKDLVPQRRKVMVDIREDTCAFLRKRGISYVPTEANMFMMDCRRPGREVASALAGEKVFVGRSWAVWPDHVRVTVGTREEMDKFKSALARVLI